METEDLDKYYTKTEISKMCLDILEKELFNLNLNLKDFFIIEPSAGSGSFLQHLSQYRYFAFDILPEGENIIKKDFIREDLGISKSRNNIVVGNPPFGKRGRLALDFINKGFEYADIVSFILPIQFRKWNMQKNIKEKAKLLYDIDIPKNSFVFKEKSYDARCCFQIWINPSFDKADIITDERIKNKPKTKHKDFEMYQYNCTSISKKYFDYEWDFAVLRQGWGNFNEKFYYRDKDNLSRKKQWIFFKAKNKEILKILENMDFNEIANLNTKTKGFGKADIIQFYNQI